MENEIEIGLGPHITFAVVILKMSRNKQLSSSWLFTSQPISTKFIQYTLILTADATAVAI